MKTTAEFRTAARAAEKELNWMPKINLKDYIENFKNPKVFSK